MSTETMLAERVKKIEADLAYYRGMAASIDDAIDHVQSGLLTPVMRARGNRLVTRLDMVAGRIADLEGARRMLLAEARS